jgi:hypothetical protein
MLEQSDGFHDDRDARAIIGGAFAAVPRIHVPAQHHQLVFELWIGAGDFGKGVVTLVVIVVELRFYVHFHFHRHFLGQQARHGAVVLD